MLSGLIDRAPMATKIELALRTVGITPEQRSDIDSVIAVLGTNPFIATILGDSPSTLPAAIARVVDTANDNSEVGVATKKTIRLALKSQKSREAVAKVVVDMISSSPKKESLTAVLMKLSELPLPGFGDTHYETGEQFISEGVLPLVSEFLNSDDEDFGTAPVPVQCPYCSENFVHHILPME